MFATTFAGVGCASDDDDDDDDGGGGGNAVESVITGNDAAA